MSLKYHIFPNAVFSLMMICFASSSKSEESSLPCFFFFSSSGTEILEMLWRFFFFFFQAKLFYVPKYHTWERRDFQEGFCVQPKQ